MLLKLWENNADRRRQKHKKIKVEAKAHAFVVAGSEEIENDRIAERKMLLHDFQNQYNEDKSIDVQKTRSSAHESRACHMISSVSKSLFVIIASGFR